MKKLHLFVWAALGAVMFVSGCSDHSSPVGPGIDHGQNGQKASAQRQFVWNAMNYWYFWQADVPKLADNHKYFSSDQAFQKYLSSFNSSKALFSDLQDTAKDRFSFFIPNYKKYNNENKGIYAALGFNYGYVYFKNINTLLGYVQYIEPGSPADSVGLKRGDIFTKVDGTKLTLSNYQDILRSNAAHTLTLAHIKNNTIFTTDSTVTVQSKRLTEDPIFHHAVIDTDGTKIGYLVYNAFHANSHKELNKVFGTFKSKGIQTLILDLRYNGGGALVTARVLGSMISGRGSSDEFAELSFNKKRSARNDTSVNFLDKVPIINSEGDFDINAQGDYANTMPMNKLSINHVYILITQGTASASEALINALKAYMNVTLIGTKTIGKNHGEFTLYDEDPPYTDVDKANPDTKFALSPMIFEITNKNHNQYPDGFKPDDKVDEINYLDDLPPLGSPKDPLVGKALSLITGHPAMMKQQARLSGRLSNRVLIKDSRDLRLHGKAMYIDPNILHLKVSRH
jgi:C-terminal processing protease CtpA/Prc